MMLVILTLFLTVVNLSIGQSIDRQKFPSAIPLLSMQLNSTVTELTETNRNNAVAERTDTSPSIPMNFSTTAAISYKSTPSTCICILPEELEDIVFAYIQKIDEEKRQCSHGRYYSFDLKSCELCIDRCESRESFELCGSECAVYFAGLESEEKFFINLAFGCVCAGLFGLLTIAVTFSARKIKKLQKDNEILSELSNRLEQRNHGAPDGDRLRLADSTSRLIGN